jgi:hypothetical protein
MFSSTTLVKGDAPLYIDSMISGMFVSIVVNRVIVLFDYLTVKRAVYREFSELSLAVTFLYRVCASVAVEAPADASSSIHSA